MNKNITTTKITDLENDNILPLIVESQLDKSEYKKDHSFFLSSITLIIVLIFQLYLVLSIENKTISLKEVLIFHFFVSVILFLWCCYCQYKEFDLRTPILIFILVSFTGIFGVLMAIIYMISYEFHIRTAKNFDDWFSDLFPDEQIKERDKIYERIIFGLDDTKEDINIDSFQDIISYGTLEQKQLALAKITRFFQPRFAPALMSAIHSKDSAIRVQAATSITKIENRFMNKLFKMEKQISEKPNDLELLIAYGVLCDNYAHCGILDSDRSRNIREKAIEVYEKCVVLGDGGEHIKRNLGRLYLRNDEADKAYLWFKECIEKDGLVSAQLLLWYMETLYITKNYKKIRELAEIGVNHSEMMGENIRTSSKVTELLQLWNKGVGFQYLNTGGQIGEQ